jgi:SKI/SNO/DAC family/c-SKI Smad4 binding domain
MTELSNVLKTYQDNALKTLQGPAAIFFNTSHHFHKSLKRELDSPPPPSSDEEFKHASPSPMQCNISIPSGTVIERAETRQISSPSTPASSLHPPQREREFCQSPSPPFVPMMQPIQSQPILTAPDSECGELMECILEGRPIGCFQQGGELRLCFPQILNNILPDFPLDRIHRTIEDLHISCLQSTQEQLAEFKHAKILPPNVPPCGLITRTNAERLCSTLLHKPIKKKDLIHSYFSFRVYHRCFGKCEGICTPDLFTFRDRECIECVECHGMMAPNKFVLHVCKNKPKENSTCHWGFESNKWRSYIHVAISEINQEKCNRLLDDMSNVEIDFERVLYEHSQMEESNNLKRKVSIFYLFYWCECENLAMPQKFEVCMRSERKKFNTAQKNIFFSTLELSCTYIFFGNTATLFTKNTFLSLSLSTWFILSPKKVSAIIP